MNVLLFVTVMIMILASLTYARLETYRSFSIVESRFKNFMEKVERGYINETVQERYNNSQAESRGPLPEKNSQSPARSRLSLSLFLDPQKRAAHPKEYAQLFLLAKKLIYMLYKDQLFFQEMEKKRPDFVDAILTNLALAEKLPQGHKIKKAEDLGTLNLQEDDLNDAFTKMLKDTPEPMVVPQPKPVERPKLLHEEQEETAEDEDKEQEKGKKYEYHSVPGYFSLLDFVTVKHAIKIRVYLAPKKLLMALFNDPAVVNGLMDDRNNIYKQLMNKGDAKALSEAFQNAYASKVDPAFSDLVDFTISKTNPKHYE